MALATAGIVFGSYQRCGIRRAVGEPEDVLGHDHLAAGLGEAASILSMNVS